MKASVQQSKKHIILIGPPNSGKTTLFNWLTGFQHRVINYPGSTVLVSVGRLLKKYGLFADVTDTPGIYSLSPQSEDELSAKKALFKNKTTPIVILVLDVNKLEVQLPLFFQLKSAGFPLLVALSMWDLLPGDSINTVELEKHLKAPVIPMKGLMGGGVEELINRLKAFVERDFKPPHQIKAWNQKRLNSVLEESRRIAQNSFLNSKGREGRQNLFYSYKWDRFFLHPVKGLFLFACIMFGLFSSIFWLASPFMNIIDNAFSFLIEQARQSLSAHPQLADFISQGVLASFGAVLVFVPQIFILFAGISLLEGTGYLARAVALMDGPFSKIGLSGRSFVPFLSGYACAIPAVLMARNLNSKRERMMNFFSIPFMTCSARLPVYALLLSFLFYGQSAWKPGAVLSLIYIASFFLGITAVLVLNSFFKKEDKESFLLDLPIYRRPVLTKILKTAEKRTRHYVVKAGPAIFTVALAIWALSHFPIQPELSPAERMQKSYAGQIGQIIEPFFKAMGADWRVGVALIAAFAAREVFVSALVVVFSVTVLSDESLTNSLLESMKKAVHANGSLIFTTASVSALIVFFMFSLQCLSTSAIVYKESGSFRLAVLQFLSLNTLAYLMAVLIYQSLNWIL